LPPDALADAKDSLRARMKSFVLGITPEQRRAASLAITDVLSRVVAAEVPPGAVVAVFASQRTEVDTAPLLARGGFRWAFPAIEGDVLVFRECAPESLVPVGALREPGPGHPIVAPDLFLVPGRAFDAAGRRLGRGRGYYDRALGRWPAIRAIGVCFSGQLVDEVPAGPLDVRMDLVVSEAGALRCDPGRRRSV